VSSASRPTPADNVATLLRCLTESVAGLGGGDRLSSWLVALIVGCIRDIEQGFARLAACLAAGTYVPCRDTPRRRPAASKPSRQKPPPQKFRWLSPIMPDAVGNRTPPECTVRDPEVAAPPAQASPPPPAAAPRPAQPTPPQPRQKKSDPVRCGGGRASIPPRRRDSG